ncbi:MAG: PilT/PilU family type 4a pilus ATPase [Myxococcales bacterium]|nr:PilT/PilU family type 4a pilus ATPase [Myxococcales bacterium]
MDPELAPSRSKRTSLAATMDPELAPPRSKRASLSATMDPELAPPRSKRASLTATMDPELAPPRGKRASLTATMDPELAPPRSKRTSIPVAADQSRSKRSSVAVASTPTPSRRQPPPSVGVPMEFGLEIGAPTPVVHARPAPAGFQAMIERATARNASDLHVASNRPISIRVLGELAPLDPSARPSSAAEVEALLRPLLSAEQEEELDTAGYVDLALEAPGGGRLRTNISRFQGGLKGTFRIARKVPPTLEQLGLPKELEKHVHHHQGLIVVSGPSGHGKTTTLAALVDLINASRPFHIITVEDPIEIVYPRRSAVVSQREVGPHTKSFAAALKGSLREDPDVIVIGELRDRETVEIALTAAETGHLVIATMSTPSAAKTIDRLVDMFPPEDQSQVRASIAGALRAIISQRLVPSADGKQVYAAVEVLTGVLALSMLIREDKLFQLPNLMQRGKAFGMIRFDDSLTELVRSGKITADAAIAASDNKKELTAQLKGGATGPGGGKPPEPAKRGGLGGLFGRKDS